MTKTLTLPKQALQAEIVPNSINPEKRTVDVVWSTGQKIGFYDWEIGEYFLTLALKEENVRLDFARQGAPVLDTHSRWGVDSVKGVVDSISVDGKKGIATLRFSKRADVEPVWQDIQDGILRFVSVGTQLHKLDDITESDDKIPHYLAVDHEPKEISLAPIPKDTGAVMQSEERPERFPVEMVSQSAHAAHHTEVHQMDKPEKTAAKKAATENDSSEIVEQGEPKLETRQPAKPSQVDTSDVIEQATKSERKRVVEIHKIAKQAKLGSEFADEMITQGIELSEVRRQALDKMATEDDKVDIRSHVMVGREERDTLRQSIESALLHRVRPAKFSLEARAHEFVGMSLLEINRDLLARQGVSTRGMSRQRIAEQSMQSTSDFPEILANVANKTLRMAYDEAPRSFVPWCRQATLPDFKQVSRNQLGESPALTLVSENGEFKHGAIGEAAEKYQLATYGKIVAITRQAIINDDLGAFDRVIPQMARAAARLQCDVVYAILTANGAMADGTVLFHADHGNLSASAAAPSVTTLGAARTSMRKQTGVDGTTLINVTPKFLIVPAAYETVAQQTMAQVTPTQATEVNPFSGSLMVIAEPRLDAASATDWYLAADPSEIDTIEYAFLEGQTGPYIETRNGFDVDGVEIKVRLDFAAKAIDWRGLYLNS